MPQTRECDYCSDEIPPGTGTMLVRTDGTTIHYCSSKCEKNADLGREPRDVEWIQDEAAEELRRAEEGETEAADESEEEADAESEDADEEEAEPEDAETDEVEDDSEEDDVSDDADAAEADDEESEADEEASEDEESADADEETEDDEE